MFLVSEKLVNKYSRNWMEQNPKSIYFPTRHGDQRGDEEEPQGGHTTGWHGPTLGHASLWCGTLERPPTLSLRLYKHPEEETLRTRSEIHEKVYSRHLHP